MHSYVNCVQVDLDDKITMSELSQWVTNKYVLRRVLSVFTPHTERTEWVGKCAPAVLYVFHSANLHVSK